MRILFITPYPTNEAPSQRFRFEQYFKELTKNGHTYETSSFLTLQAWNILYKQGHIIEKIWALFRGYFQRIIDSANEANKRSKEAKMNCYPSTSGYLSASLAISEDNIRICLTHIKGYVRPDFAVQVNAQI